jgi:hypothetical protein
MTIENKLKVLGDSIMYDDDQVAFIMGTHDVVLSLTDEDLENAEMPLVKCKEVVANRSAIVNWIKSNGYNIVEELDELGLDSGRSAG